MVQNYKTNLKQNIRIIWSGISLMADYLAVLLAEMIAIYFSEENLRYIDLFIVIPFIYIAFIAAARTYRRIIPFWQRVESLFYSSIYSIIAVLLFFFVRASSTEHSIAFLALLWLASFICLVIMRYLLKRILDERNIFQIPLLIIGAQEEALAFTKAINNDIGMSSYKIVGLISDRIPVKGLENYPLLGDFKDIEKIIKTTGINNVLIAIPYLEHIKKQEIIHRVQPLVRNICIIPSLSAIPMGGADLETFFDEKFMLIRIRNNLARNINKLIKLIFDLIVGLLICIPVIPIIIACAIWVKLDSKGPIFYNAKRIGKNGKEFTCYKFRSMYTNGDELLTQYLAENPVAKKEQISVNNASLEALKAKQAEAQESIATLSADGVEYMRLSREATITGQVYTSLVQNYEQTRIQEAKDSMDIQIIDAADLPKEDMPAKPNKKLVVVIGFVLGIMISFGYTLYNYSRRYGL